MSKTENSTNNWSNDSSGSSKFVITILLVLFLASAAGLGFTYYKYNTAKKALAKISSTEGQKAMAKKEIDDLLAKVKRHMVLPQGEDPVVATVTDKDALAKEQPFYKDANNGDRVIAYMVARKAIIYDPIHDVVVNAGPIYIDNTKQGTSTPAK